MLILALSDFHLGAGRFLNNGQVNIFEDFDEDEKFAEFLDYYSGEMVFDEELHSLVKIKRSLDITIYDELLCSSPQIEKPEWCIDANAFYERIDRYFEGKVLNIYVGMWHDCADLQVLLKRSNYTVKVKSALRALIDFYLSTTIAEQGGSTCVCFVDENAEDVLVVYNGWNFQIELLSRSSIKLPVA